MQRFMVMHSFMVMQRFVVMQRFMAMHRFRILQRFMGKRMFMAMQEFVARHRLIMMWKKVKFLNGIFNIVKFARKYRATYSAYLFLFCQSEL